MAVYQEDTVSRMKWRGWLTSNLFGELTRSRVYTNAHILSKGLILVDLPGLRDLNSARRAITERHLREVNEIFAICLIGRATTDAGVAAVFDLAKRARLTNVGIICTKSDVSSPWIPVICGVCTNL